MSLVRKNLLHLAWLMALTGTAGSLFFSEVMDLPPCILCWYQRIAMYPLVIILLVGIIKRDQHVRAYAIPFALLGLVISTYHNLLYYGVVPEGITPCTEGVPCTQRQLEWLGFITIPLMGLIGFAAILAALIFARVRGHEES